MRADEWRFRHAHAATRSAVGTLRADRAKPQAREQSYIHKAQELAITWMLEALLDKERIFDALPGFG